MYDKSKYDVLSIIESIAAVPGKNDKLAILKKHQLNDDLKKSFGLALNSLISFYVKKLPEVTEHKGTLTLEAALDGLINLSNRTYTGNAALAYVQNQLEALSENDAEVYRRVLLRDLRCGASEGSTEKTWPGLVPKFAVMLATSYSEKALAKIVYPAYAQLKSDGARSEAIIDVDLGVCTFFSRNGKEMHLSPRSGQYLIDALKGAGYKGKWVLDGEMVFMTEDGVADRSTGNGIVNKAVKGTLEWEEEKNLHFDVWDIVSYEDFQAEKGNEPYTVRLERLNKLVPNSFWSVIPTHIVNSLAEAKKVYSDYIAEGLEGIILKNMHMIWENDRSKDQVKFKQELRADLEVLDVLPGKKGKKYEHMAGSVTMGTRDGKLKVNVAGISDDLREWFMKNKEEAKGTIWEVLYNGIVKARGSDVYKLFLPRIDHQRLDKNEANSLEELQEAATEASL